MGRKDKNADDQQMEVSGFTGMMMTIFFAVLSLAFLFPIFLVFMNAFKSKLYISDAPFRFPVAEAYIYVEPLPIYKRFDIYINDRMVYYQG